MGLFSPTCLTFDCLPLTLFNPYCDIPALNDFLLCAQCFMCTILRQLHEEAQTVFYLLQGGEQRLFFLIPKE